MMRVNGETQIVGVVGWPIEHTLSPAMHNAAFASLGLNWIYVPLPVRVDQLAAATRGMPAMGLRGANITIPHKESIMEHLDSVSPAAETIGAVNTILCEDGGRTVGDNTDWLGFLEPLRARGLDVGGKQALLLGAGGAARAVAYALARSGAHVVVMSRTAARAQRLVDGLRDVAPDASLRSRSMDLQGLLEKAEGSDLLVNATPVGMWPHEDTSPWPDGIPIPKRLIVYDLVYRPAITKLMQQAAACEAATIGGLDMLVHQAALAFEMWTEQSAPVGVMQGAAERSLGEG